MIVRDITTPLNLPLVAYALIIIPLLECFNKFNNLRTAICFVQPLNVVHNQVNVLLECSLFLDELIQFLHVKIGG